MSVKIRRKSVGLIFCLCLLCSSIPLFPRIALATPIMDNGGFEDGPSQSAWVPWSNAGATLQIDSTHQRSGSYSASIHSTSQTGVSIWAQDGGAGLVGGEHLLLSGYIRTDNVTASGLGGARLSITFYDNTAGLAGYVTSDYITGTSAYSLEQILVSTPFNAASYRISLELNEATGTVYIDDVSLAAQARTVGVQTDAEIRQDGGMPTLYIEGEKEAPMIFCGNTDFTNPTQLNFLYEQFNKAGQNGVDLGCIVMNLPWAFVNWLKFDEIIENVVDANPDVKLIIRTRVAPSAWWTAKYPADMLQKSDGTYHPYMASYGSERWISEAQDNLRLLIRHVRTSDYSANVIGYSLQNANTDEWFYQDLDEFSDYNTLNVAKFRLWLTAKYGTSAALKSAWADPGVTLGTAGIPTPTERMTINKQFMIDVASAGTKVPDYIQYHNEVVAETISTLTEVIKAEAGSSKSLAGTFYGYINELAQGNTFGVNHSGHIAMQKLLADPNIDLIAGPYSYVQRGIGEAAGWHSPIDSVMAAGKLYIMEDDTRTHLSSDTFAQTANLSETLEVVRRNFGQTISHGAGMWYFDLNADGTWNDNSIWNEIGALRTIYLDHLATPRNYVPDVAVIYSEKTPYRLRSDRYFFDQPALSQWRFEFQRMGARVGFYLEEQLNDVPDETKLFVFVNNYHLSDDEKAAITAKVKRNGNTALWVYAPGYITDQGVSLSSMSQLIGMEMKEYNTANMPLAIEITNGDHPISRNEVHTSYGIETAMSPTFYVDDPAATTLGYYEGGNMEDALAVKQLGAWTSIYSGSPSIPAAMLRSIAQYAGVHLYTDDSIGTNGAVYAAGELAVMHMLNGGTAGSYAIKLPDLADTVTDALSNAAISTQPSVSFNDTLVPATTSIYNIVKTSKGMNLLTNSGFESGKSGWAYHGNDSARWSVSDEFVEGAHSSELARSGGGNNDIVYQTIPVAGGITYQLEGFIRTDISHSDGRASLIIAGFDANGQVVDYINKAYGGKGTWRRVVLDYAPSAGVAYFQLQFVGSGTWNSGDRALADSLQVRPSYPANGGFENGKADWLYYGPDSTRWDIAADTVRDGTKSARLARTGGGNNDIIYQNITVAPGATYYMEGYVKSNLTNTGGSAQLVIAGFDSGGAVVDYMSQSFSGQEGWRKGSMLYTPSATVAYFAVQCVGEGTWNSGDRAWFDGIAVSEING